MNIKNCRSCKRLFNYVAGPSLCPECKKKLEEKFAEVKKYIYEHDNAGMVVVSEECDVDIAQIKQWVKEERLVFSNPSMSGLACERCGILVTSGRFCDKCKVEMTHAFNSAIGKGNSNKVESEPENDSINPKMRYLDK